MYNLTLMPSEMRSGFGFLSAQTASLVKPATHCPLRIGKGFRRPVYYSQNIMTDFSDFRLPLLVPRDERWCVYLLLCGNDALYCGISNRPEARFAAHLAGKGAKFTRMHPPREMRLLYVGLSRSEAMRLEPRIKRLSAVQKRKLWAYLAEYSEN